MTISIQDKLAAQRAAQMEAKANPEAAALAAKEAAAAAAAKEEDVVYQQFRSSKPSTRVVTDKGIRVNFVAHELLTNDPHVIEYLETQVVPYGLTGISKGEAMTLADRNPMATLERNLRDQIRKELEEEMIAKARGETRDMGTTERAGMKVTTSNQTAS